MSGASIGLSLDLALKSYGASGFTGLLDTYGGAAAAYSLRALSSGWLAGDVVEVRPSRGVAAESFTASQINNGQMLSFVNGGTTDLYNSARYFNGTSTEVTIPDSADFTVSTSIDVSADVLLTSTAPVGIVNKGVGTPTNREWLLGVNGSNRLEFIVFDESLSTNVSASTADFPTNELFTARGYYDGSDIYIYVNGVQKATTAGVVAIENLAADIQIGNSLAASRNLHGIASNVCIAVDGAEVAAYTGLGTSVTAWEDTIGSNDGTEANGAAYTGQPFDGFVSTWYDQSGNANNATQATTTAQPKIVSAGALVTGGLDFDGVDDALTATSSLSAQPCSLFYQFSTKSNVVRLYDFATNEVRGLIAGGDDGRGQSSRAGLLFLSSFTATNSQQYLRADIYNGASSIIRVDGSQETGNPSTDIPSGNLTIGGSTSSLNGTMNEIIIYPDNQAANIAAIQSAQNDFYTIY